jgi:threonine dehydrogenase-like Zn-dependent dehydrogenase
MNKCRAMVLERFNQPLQMREYPVPEPGQNEVLVKVTAAGVCGSDVHMWRGEDPRTPLPIILGHEGVGKVVSLNGERRDILGNRVQEGDAVLWHRGVSCGDCYYCAIVKEPSLCQSRLVYGINRSCGEAPYLRGSYGEQILLDARTILFPVPEEVDPSVLVAATCSGSTAAHAFDLYSPSIGDSVLVQGPGPLGLFAVAMARSRGAGEVIVIGGTAARLEMCRRFGATIILNRHRSSLEERHEAVLEATGGRGVDYAVEAVGLPEAVEEGVTLVRPGGVYMLAGFGDPRGKASLDCFHDIVQRNLRLQGVWVSDVRHTYMAYKLVLQNPGLFGEMVSHRFTLENATAALKAMEEKEALKAVIRMED